VKYRVLSPVGVEVTDFAVNEVTAPGVVELQRLLAEHGVAVMRGQDVDDAGFVSFLSRFGDLLFSPGETPLVGFSDLNVISNVGRSTPPRSVFHVDTSYVQKPPAYTALRAVEIPVSGGETLFTNQYRAYDTLPADIQNTLAGRTITHVVTGLDLEPGDEARAEHPALQRHPISGRTALYLSTPQRCVGVSGLEENEARELIEFLYAHSTAPANTHRHAWAPGDVVMWDNRCVLHRADHADVVGDRVMHRGMVSDVAA
jgi:taurine dioxygenase